MNESIDASLDALYNINKHAKSYAERGTENYRKGKKTTAKANSNKKKALYAVKERVLTALMDEGSADRVTRHKIRGDPFWCVYFTDSEGEEWSFHSPEENLAVDAALVANEAVRDLEDFSVGSEKERSSESLKASLLHLESEFEVNANDHLPDQYLYYGHNRYFIGWKYLGEDTDESEQETLA